MWDKSPEIELKGMHLDHNYYVMMEIMIIPANPKTEMFFST